MSTRRAARRRGLSPSDSPRHRCPVPRQLSIGLDMTTTLPASTFSTDGDLDLRRLRFQTVRLTGPGMSGYPHDVDDAITVLRRAAELGVSLIDKADSYRPFVTHDPIRKALHPYPEHLAIETKTGVSRPRRAGTDRAPRVPSPAGRTQPPAPGRGADRPAPTAPCRRRGATRRPSRRARPPPGRRQDPPHRPARGHRSARSRPFNGSHPSPRCTTWSTAPRPTYSTTPSPGERRSSPTATDRHRIHRPRANSRTWYGVPERRSAGSLRPGCCAALP